MPLQYAEKINRAAKRTDRILRGRARRHGCRRVSQARLRDQYTRGIDARLRGFNRRLECSGVGAAPI